LVLRSVQVGVNQFIYRDKKVVGVFVPGAPLRRIRWP
jgi:hypothetical protein